MSKGYVYILTNDAMPGLVKIGMTTGDTAARAAQLHTTGVPVPFKVYADVYAPDCAALEQIVHKSLAKLRVHNSREFFSCSPGEAEKTLNSCHVEMVSVWMSEFLPCHQIVEDLMHIDPSTVLESAERAGGTDL